MSVTFDRGFLEVERMNGKLGQQSLKIAPCTMETHLAVLVIKVKNKLYHYYLFNSSILKYQLILITEYKYKFYK